MGPEVIGEGIPVVNKPKPNKPKPLSAEPNQSSPSCLGEDSYVPNYSEEVCVSDSAQAACFQEEENICLDTPTRRSIIMDPNYMPQINVDEAMSDKEEMAFRKLGKKFSMALIDPDGTSAAKIPLGPNDKITVVLLPGTYREELVDEDGKPETDKTGKPIVDDNGKPLVKHMGTMFIIVKPSEGEWYIREELTTVVAGPPQRINIGKGDIAIPTPAGSYRIERLDEGYTTSSWPDSVIPQGAEFSINNDGKLMYNYKPGEKTGTVEDAFYNYYMGSRTRNKAGRNKEPENFSDPAGKNRRWSDLSQNEKATFWAKAYTENMRYDYLDSKGHFAGKPYQENPFGTKTIHMSKLIMDPETKRPRRKIVPYKIHTIPEGRVYTDTNSHGCIHLPELEDPEIGECFNPNRKHKPRVIVERYGIDSNSQTTLLKILERAVDS